MTDLESLTKLKELLSDPNRWMQGYLAQNDKGDYVSPLQEDACKFCLDGAICNVNKALAKTLPNLAVVTIETLPGHKYLQKATGRRLLWYFNDESEHADIVKSIDKAIELAKAENLTSQ